MIENPRTGEQIEFDTSDPDVLVMQSTWTRPGHRAVQHIHPIMEERFEVVSGRAAFRVEGVESILEPGEVLVVPPGSAHLAWNPTEDRVVLRLEMRPPLRWEEFTRRLFAGDPVRELFAEYADEVFLPPAD